VLLPFPADAEGGAAGLSVELSLASADTTA
jgi:hypothetical protein